MQSLLSIPVFPIENTHGKKQGNDLWTLHALHGGRSETHGRRSVRCSWGRVLAWRSAWLRTTAKQWLQTPPPPAGTMGSRKELAEAEAETEGYEAEGGEEAVRLGRATDFNHVVELGLESRRLFRWRFCA